MQPVEVTGLDLAFPRRAIELAREARNDGRHPFGALIVNEHGETVTEARNNAVLPIAIPGLVCLDGRMQS